VTLLKLASVALGGAVGAMLRYAVSLWAAERLGTAFPFGTLIVNLAGCLLIGMLSVVVGALPGHDWTKALLVTGFLGALTTFSTFAFETWSEIEAGRWVVPAVNVGVSCVAGLALVALGLRAGRWIVAALAGGSPGG
jgi:CrcB protein